MAPEVTPAALVALFTRFVAVRVSRNLGIQLGPAISYNMGCSSRWAVRANAKGRPLRTALGESHYRDVSYMWRLCTLHTHARNLRKYGYLRALAPLTYPANAAINPRIVKYAIGARAISANIASSSSAGSVRRILGTLT